MNTFQRKWLTWKHRRKFARLGAGCTYPITDLTVDGHLEQGDRGRFRNNATFRTHGTGKIIFGNRAGAAWGCLIEASELVRIDDYTAMAEYTYVTDTVFDFRGTAGHWREVPRYSKPVHIGSACFIGSGCYIGPGVTIGDGAVIAHHSVITRDIGPLEIWGGNPARKMGHRTENVPESKRRELEEMIEKYGIQSDRYKDDE